jgi:hypothetical protein
MPLKQPNLIIFKNLSLIDSLRGGERQRLTTTTTTTTANDKDNDKSERQRQRRNPPSAKGASTPFKKVGINDTNNDKD